MKAIALIPSRLESKRLPGKALLDIDGLPIVVHTAKRAQLSKNISEVYVCTDSDQIINECKKHQIETIKTESHFVNGTERIASIAHNFNDSIIVDVQGDEPLINPKYIDKLVDAHLNHSENPEVIIPTIEVPYNSNETIVRVISASSGRVMYLSRGNIPYSYKTKISLVSKHVSVISFTSKALKKYSSFNPSSLETIEDIELLRALENDMRVFSIKLAGKSFSVDVDDDYLKSKIAMLSDPVRKLYE